MLYKLLKILIRISLKVFFKKVKIQNKELIPKKGPMLVIANHPNTFMDPLLVAANIKPEVFFIANASAFASPLSQWLLGKLNMIPIQRKIDKNKEKFNNQDTFQKCYDFLGKKGTILIFPEGTSIRERKIRKLKTGTARIGLGAENDHNFELDLVILPMGLNYSKPESFRSEVFINIGKPVKVADFKEDYRQDNFGAARKLTTHLEDILKELTIVTQNKEEEKLAENVANIYNNTFSEQVKLSEKKEEQAFLLHKGIVEAIHFFEEENPEKVVEIKSDLESYQQELTKLKLKDNILAIEKRGNILWQSLRNALYFILGFPLYLYGIINNYIPYIIPSQVASKLVKLTKVEEYTAPVMMITGIFSFGIFYALQIWIFYVFVPNFWFRIAYILSLPISAFFALFYYNYWKITQNKWHFFALFRQRKALVEALLRKRKAIIEKLEDARKEFEKS